MSTALKSPRRQRTVGGSPPKASRMGRDRVREPDPFTPEGQCALYLQHLLTANEVDAKSLAATIGKARSTVFNYLSGDTTPSDSVRQDIAKALGLRDYRDLMPTDAFLATLPRRRRRS